MARRKGDPLLETSEAQIKNREWDKAIVTLESLIESDPANFIAYHRLAQVYKFRGLVNKVTEQYLKLIELYLRADDIENVINICYEIIKIEPENPIARNKLADILFKNGYKEEALKQYMALAKIYTNLNDYDRAIMVQRKATELIPENLNARITLASMYVDHGQIKEGNDCYREVANSYMEQGKELEASDVYRKIIVLQPDDIETRITLGKLYKKQGKLDEAETEFRSVLRYKLTHIDALVQLAEVSQMKGKIEGAILAYRKINDISPNDPFAREKIGDLYATQGQTSTAVKSYLSAAEIYHKTGKINDAIRLYQNIVAIEPQNAVAVKELKELKDMLASGPPPEKREPAAPVTPVTPPALVQQQTQQAQQTTRPPVTTPTRPTTPTQPPVTPTAPAEKTPPPATEEKPRLLSLLAKGKQVKKPHLFSKDDIQRTLAAEEEKPFFDERTKDLSEESTLKRLTRKKEEPSADLTGDLSDREVTTDLSKEMVAKLTRKVSPPETQKELPRELPPEPFKETVPPKEPVHVEKTPEPLVEKIKEPPKREKVVINNLIELEKFLENKSAEEFIKDCQMDLQEKPEDIEIRTSLALTYEYMGLLDQAIKEYNVLIQKMPQNTKLYYRLIDAISLNSDEKEIKESYLEVFQMVLQNKIITVALDLIQKLVAIDPEDMTTRRMLAEHYMEQNQIEEALYQYNNMAAIYNARGLTDKVIENYNKIIEIKKEDLDIRYRLAIAYGQIGMSEQAINEFKQVAEVYSKKKNWEKSTEIYQNILNLQPENIDIRLKLSEFYTRQGDSNKAIEQDLYIANIYFQNSEFEKAVETYHKILGFEPRHTEARNQVIEVYLKMNMTEKAISEYRILADFYLKQGLNDKAIEVYQKIIKLDTSNRFIHNKLADLYSLNGFVSKAVSEYLIVAQLASKDNPDEAIDAYKKILKLDPTNLDAHYNVACLYENVLGNYDLAIDSFKKVVELNPNFSSAYQHLAELYGRKGNILEAVRATIHYTTLEPSKRPILKEMVIQYQDLVDNNPNDAIIRYNLGVIYHEVGELDKAIEQFQHLVNVQRIMKLSSYKMLGHCFMKQGMLDLAIKQYKKGLTTAKTEKGEDDLNELQEIRYYLAQLFERKGDYDKAIEMYGEIYGVDIKYRDVAEKLRALKAKLAA